MFGGQVFCKFALYPVMKVIDDPATRGKVVNSGWLTFNSLGVAGLGAVSAVRLAARTTELAPARQTPAERTLSRIEDGLLAASVLLTALTGIQGRRLAAKAPDGAVPIESGREPEPRTPRGGQPPALHRHAGQRGAARRPGPDQPPHGAGPPGLHASPGAARLTRLRGGSRTARPSRRQATAPTPRDDEADR